tara:strand:+ start:10476 stop:10862 length:387 start_codon:yes stop_codon:yes gene_type:complete
MKITFKRTTDKQFLECYHVTTSFSDTLYNLKFENNKDADSLLLFQKELDKDIEVCKDEKDIVTFLFPNLSSEDWVKKGLDVRFRDEQTSFAIESFDKQEMIYFWFNTKFNMDKYIKENLKKLTKVEVK